jgi:hydroxymethylbilane synthase
VRRLRIGTRGSPLARWQAETVAAAIARAGGPAAELVLIRTSGDRLANKPISGAGGKRLFVKEIEEALVDGRVDVAVHSAKDLPAERLPGLNVQAVLPREDARDAVVARRSPAHAAGDPDVLFAPESAPRVGTGSVRRSAQLRHAYPHLDIAPIRGNVGTRLDKLEAGGFDLLVLAAAGLVRLGLAPRITVRLPVDLCVPAPGQGIVCAEYRGGDEQMRALLAAIADRDAAAGLEAERALVTALGADCQVPLGGVTTVDGDRLVLRGVVAAPDGGRLVRHESEGSPAAPAALGAAVAAGLLAAGAGPLLDAARAS